MRHHHQTGTTRFYLWIFAGLCALMSAALAGQSFTTTNLPISCGATPCEPNAVVIADFNNDGKMDLAVTNYRANSVAILLGNGNGTFRAPVFYPVDQKPSSIATADFNNDGVPDLVVTNEGSSTTSVLLGVGDGTFQPAVRYTVAVGSHYVTTADFNNDGFPDLAVTADRFQDPTNMISILLNKADGTGLFNPAGNIPGGSHPHALAAGDLDLDGNVDLVIANLTEGTLNVRLGNGNGTFRDGAAISVGPMTFPHHVLAIDVNNDGILDLVTADSLNDTVSVFLGNGDGTFALVDQYPVGYGPLHVEAGDFNGDGITDLAVANNSSDNVSILIGVGDGTFQPARNFAAAAGTTSLAVGILNGSTRSSVAAVNVTANSITLLLSQ